MTAQADIVPIDADSARVLDAVADYFSVLSSPTRLRILRALCDGERAVADIVAGVRSGAANVSQHLRLMEQAGVLARRRDGQQMFYRIADAKAVEICRFVATWVAADSGPSGASR